MYVPRPPDLRVKDPNDLGENVVGTWLVVVMWGGGMVVRKAGHGGFGGGPSLFYRDTTS